jgi:hypothetical protein
MERADARIGFVDRYFCRWMLPCFGVSPLVNVMDDLLGRRYAFHLSAKPSPIVRGMSGSRLLCALADLFLGLARARRKQRRSRAKAQSQSVGFLMVNERKAISNSDRSESQRIAFA